MRFLALTVLLAGVALAEPEEQAQQPYPRLRTYIGGISEGGALNDGNYYVGAGGVAADVGVQIRPDLAFNGVLRASTSGLMSLVRLGPSFEWSHRAFSLGLGIAGALRMDTAPTIHVNPYLMVPLTVGLTLDEARDGIRLGAMRMNLEIAFVWNPMTRGTGAIVGFSIGRQSR
jgi:hypothetical protein